VAKNTRPPFKPQIPEETRPTSTAIRRMIEQFAQIPEETPTSTAIRRLSDTRLADHPIAREMQGRSEQLADSPVGRKIFRQKSAKRKRPAQQRALAFIEEHGLSDDASPYSVWNAARDHFERQRKTGKDPSAPSYDVFCKVIKQLRGQIRTPN
jgi:hypothetical protein